VLEFRAEEGRGRDPDGDARRRAKAGLRRAAAGPAESRSLLPSIGSGESSACSWVGWPGGIAPPGSLGSRR